MTELHRITCQFCGNFTDMSRTSISTQAGMLYAYKAPNEWVYDREYGDFCCKIHLSRALLGETYVIDYSVLFENLNNMEKENDQNSITDSH